MSASTLLILILFYFSVILVISLITGRKSDNASFFLGNKKSPWFVVAFAMIGTSLSGVTFISVPGWVGTNQFSYLQLVFGYMLGYFVIGTVLMPMYYKLNLTSIYTYLEERFGIWTYKTGAFFFLLSRTIGAAFRLFLVANVLYITVFKVWGIPFEATVIITLLFIWLYTFRGGIKTIIWTDIFQTAIMLVALAISIIMISKSLHLNLKGLYTTIANSEHSRIFFFDNWSDKKHFIKQFLSGAFIAIVMTGLDQDMMQKNLSCKNLKEAQKNMLWFSISLIFVNLLFLCLGVLLYVFAHFKGIAIPARSDDLFPIIATGGYLGSTLCIAFILGIIAVTYSSSDSALTALTTSFTVDIVDIRNLSEEKIKKIRKRVHIAFSIILMIVIIIFKAINNEAVISAIFTVAGYTYGPLLGFYSFGFLTKYKIKDSYWVPVIAIASPILCYLLHLFSSIWFNGFQFGYELLIVNGFITFLGLFILRQPNKLLKA